MREGPHQNTEKGQRGSQRTSEHQGSEEQMIPSQGVRVVWKGSVGGLAPNPVR